ncbi:NYN domain-containing protein [Nonomuraea sp. KC401]|uniref:NYN domain-containing protein n=1 Tax=unclassified Nonomuraea TaxID=2593643 RepID=UPI0010FF3D24|nr:NYN domain-containing protein [Nonomuraea sp. KC401]NBE96790.1 NYN domain-containing protein [Nonomuraea sp. K271]TLF67917.1 NYN domain-containing protein [Nonomuraea sp. KC401]
MDRCALFVDAGYLLADGAMAVHGTRHREAVSWDYPGLLQLMTGLSRERTGLPLLRCYWYEATVEGRRTPEHDALADIPGLKLRLSRIRPGRREGVDAQVHRDLMTLARNNAICDAVVLSGDEDLAQVVCDAQDLGIRVSVIHIAVEGSWAVSRSLRQECDDLVELGAVHLRPYVSMVSGGAETANGHHQPISNGQATHSLPPGQSSTPALPSLPQASPSGSHASGNHAAGDRASGSHATGSHSGGHAAGSHSGGHSGNHSTGNHAGNHAGSHAAAQSQPSSNGPSPSGQGQSSTPSLPTYANYQPEPQPPPQQPAAQPGTNQFPSQTTGGNTGQYTPPTTGGNTGQFPSPTTGTGQYASPTSGSNTGQYASPTTGSNTGQYASPTSGSNTGQYASPAGGYQQGPYSGPQPAPVTPSASTAGATTLSDAVKAAHREGHDFGESVARDAPALWLEAVLARKPRMPSDLEARLLQGSSLPIDFLLHDEVRHALRRGFWDALERARQ